jgi:hypothetical protein
MAIELLVRINATRLPNSFTAFAKPAARSRVILALFHTLKEPLVDRQTIYTAAAIAALAAFAAVLVMGFGVTPPDPSIHFQPSDLSVAPADFARATNAIPALALRYFAADSLFVLSYLLVFAGLYAATAERARPFAVLGLGAGVLAALCDATENAFFITYASLSAQYNVRLTEPALPLLYLITNLKWMGAFAALYAFGLVLPRDGWYARALTALMLLFPVVGVLGVAMPGLIALRGLFFLIGMPMFAWYFWSRR